ncbi:hypothetical protein [Salininema proteolyticum]|uniref:Uncharacterized protein n=1 Tax=Salininema proteolyticum TaxID=1607685 RepID=A0ABV8U426_9ACTN
MNFEELDALSTPELQSKAFAVAREKGDWRFFVDLMRHTGAAKDTEDLTSDLAEVGNAVEELVGMWRQASAGTWGDIEPLARAEFIDYLMKNAEEEPPRLVD